MRNVFLSSYSSFMLTARAASSLHLSLYLSPSLAFFASFDVEQC